MVSIIIPTYNYAHTLAETLKSVKDQSYTDWECIVIDDGSTDNSGEVVNKFVTSDSRFRYIYQTNSGVSSARNAGIKMAKGDYIQFLDGDDLLQTDKISTQLDTFSKNTAVDIVYGPVRFFDNDNKQQLKTSLKGDKPDDWMPKLTKKGKEVVKHFSKINFLVIHSPLIKKEVFDKVGSFDESMKALEDWDFWMRCALENCYFYFAEQQNSFALVRVHAGSLSTETALMNKGNFMFLQHTLTHKSTGFEHRIILSLKYIELFWDTLFRRAYFSTNSTFLTILSILALPYYLIIKIVRAIK